MEIGHRTDLVMGCEESLGAATMKRMRTGVASLSDRDEADNALAEARNKVA